MYNITDLNQNQTEYAPGKWGSCKTIIYENGHFGIA